MTVTAVRPAPARSRPRPSAGDRLRAGFRNNRWWITRVAVMPVHLFVFAVLSFGLLRLMPGDPVAAILGDQPFTQEDYDRLQASLGLSGSLPEQFITYLQGLLTLDLGTSLVTLRPVAEELAVRIPPTLELAAMGMLACVIVSVGASLLAVVRPRGVVARIMTGYSRAAGAIPDFVLAVVGLIVLYATLRVLPAPMGRLSAGLPQPTTITGFPLLDTVLQGYWDATWDMTAHLVLPVAVLALSQAPIMTNLLITGLRKAIDAPPTLFRIATGASRFTVYLSVYRRAVPAAVTIAGSIFAGLIGGAIIIEQMFGFVGLGSYASTAVGGSDNPALQGFLLVAAALVLVVFLLVDVLNMLIDPRRRPGVGQED
jgi:ABC-type dipeptide/oligopeptide/nickel transport system permease component